LCGLITKLAGLLKKLDHEDIFGITTIRQTLEILYKLAIIPHKKSLSQLEEVTVAAFCRRRLAVMLPSLGVVTSIQKGIDLIKRGHIRVGPHIVTDPGFHVTRALQGCVFRPNESKKIDPKMISHGNSIDDYELITEK